MDKPTVVSNGDHIVIVKSDFSYREGRSGVAMSVFASGLIEFRDDISGSTIYTHVDNVRHA